MMQPPWRGQGRDEAGANRLFNKKCGNETGKKRKMFPFHKRFFMYLDKNEGNVPEFM